MGKKFDIHEYKRLKNKIKKHYEEEKTGEQNLYQETTKLYKPLIDTSKETTKQLENAIMDTSKETTKQ